MPITTSALTTLEGTKYLAGLASAYTTDDANLIDMIEDWSQVVTSYCQRNFLYASYTDEKQEGSDRQLIFLNNYPVWTITSVKSDDVVISASEYEMSAYDGSRGAVYKDNGWSSTKFTSGLLSFEPTAKGRTYKFTYTAGYYTPADPLYSTGGVKQLPRDIQKAVASIVAEEYVKIKNGGLGLQSVSQGKLSYTFRKNDSDNYLEGVGIENSAIINKYRRLWLG